MTSQCLSDEFGSPTGASIHSYTTFARGYGRHLRLRIGIGAGVSDSRTDADCGAMLDTGSDAQAGADLA